MTEPTELLHGTLDALVLKTLAWAPRHGYAIARWIESRGGSELLRIEEGSLYPALYRLERRGWIEAEWGLSETKRRVKIYRLTEAGRKHPMYAGKLDVFNAPTVHLDEVEALAPGTTVLATNAVSDVQSAEIRNAMTVEGDGLAVDQAIRQGLGLLGDGGELLRPVESLAGAQGGLAILYA